MQPSQRYPIVQCMTFCSVVKINFGIATLLRLFETIDVALDVDIWIVFAFGLMTLLMAFKPRTSENVVLKHLVRVLGSVTEPLLPPFRFLFPADSKVDASPVVLLLACLAMRYVIALYVIRKLA